ncbi:hypothetical protein GGX14DRAFT_408398 [Mycena pura]|uniref:Uncharacterized protein n=1 Tax=Mycena pura TaxID=153505 RepID=A0AAD6UTD6_9AGAR|nr:hypothetical protein GGX14DRAFT_408398 [Mycena pura]
MHARRRRIWSRSPHIVERGSRRWGMRSMVATRSPAQQGTHATRSARNEDRVPMAAALAHLHDKVFMSGLLYALCTRVCIPVGGRIVCETLTTYDALRMHMLDHTVACAECVCPARGAGGEVEKDKTYCQLSSERTRTGANSLALLPRAHASTTTHSKVVASAALSLAGAPSPATSRGASEAECGVALSSGLMSLQAVSSDPPVGSRTRCINPSTSRMTIKSQPDLIESPEVIDLMLSDSEVKPSIAPTRRASPAGLVNPGSSDVEDPYATLEGLQTTNGGRADIISRVQFGEFEVMREVNVKRREYVTDPPPFIAVHEESTAIVVDLRDGKFEGLRDAQGKNNDAYRGSMGNGPNESHPTVTFFPGLPPIKCRRFRLDCKDTHAATRELPVASAVGRHRPCRRSAE